MTTDRIRWWFPSGGYRDRRSGRRAAYLALALGVIVAAGAVAAADAVAATGSLTEPRSAEPADRYQRSMATADGIGKRYMGREISGVMGWQGAGWLERAEREREERTADLLAILDPRPAMIVADIGAGTGYLSRRLAPRVVPGGRIVAVDVQPQMIERLQALAAKAGLGNIESRLGLEDDVRLPEASVDMAVMVDVYHELAYPYETLASVVRALKPGGLMVFVEYRAEDPAVPIKALHKMTEAQIRREAEVHPLVWDRTVATLPWQHVVFFRRSPQ